MTQRAMGRKFCLADIVQEQLERFWNLPFSQASRLTIQRTGRNFLVLLRLSFQPKMKLKLSQLQTIHRLDSEGRSTRQISRGPSASPAVSRRGWFSSTIRM